MNTPSNPTLVKEVSVNGLRYTYTIHPFKVTNAIGAVMATLDEYQLIGSAGDNIELYKTKEGSWYEIKQPDSAFKNAIILALKSAIDKAEMDARQFSH